ncbi:hypothetical protein BGW80DRAFT_243194 [Lactifluus volemus]|nr:hypothetical protein BGW80DRAFT_243194 [Lactifluus volemus]
MPSSTIKQQVTSHAESPDWGTLVRSTSEPSIRKIRIQEGVCYVHASSSVTQPSVSSTGRRNLSLLSHIVFLPDPVTGLSRKLEPRLQPPISSIPRVVIIFVFRVVYTGYSIALRALAALRSLRIQLFHDAQPLQAKIAEKKLSLPADRDC